MEGHLGPKFLEKHSLCHGGLSQVINLAVADLKITCSVNVQVLMKIIQTLSGRARLLTLEIHV